LHHYKIYRLLFREWKKINQQSFNRSVKNLIDKKLLEERKLDNGSYKLVLTNDGKKHEATVLARDPYRDFAVIKIRVLVLE